MLVKNPSGSSAVMSEMSFRNSWHLRYCLSGTLFKTKEVFDAPVITPEEEDKLWLSSVLSLTSTILLGIWQNQEHIKPAEYTLSMSQSSEQHLLCLKTLSDAKSCVGGV